MTVSGVRLRIVTQDISDRGSKALEKPLGADIYIGIEDLTGPARETKGLLVQAKMRKYLHSMSLKEDCEKMLRRSKASYVWVYDERGLKVLDAQQIVGDPDHLSPNTKQRLPSTLFSRVLKCVEGDRALGLPDVSGNPKEQRHALARQLENLRIPRVISFSLLRNEK